MFFLCLSSSSSVSSHWPKASRMCSYLSLSLSHPGIDSRATMSLNRMNLSNKEISVNLFPLSEHALRYCMYFIKHTNTLCFFLWDLSHNWFSDLNISPIFLKCSKNFGLISWRAFYASWWHSNAPEPRSSDVWPQNHEFGPPVFRQIPLPDFGLGSGCDI